MRRVTEIVLIAASLVAGSVLAGIALTRPSGPHPAAPAAAQRTASPFGSLAPPATPAPADRLDTCLGAAGLEVEDISELHPAPVRALRLTGEGDLLLFVFVFGSEAEAGAFEAGYPEADLVPNLGTVLVEYTEPPSAGLEADVERCAVTEP